MSVPTKINELRGHRSVMSREGSGEEAGRAQLDDNGEVAHEEEEPLCAERVRLAAGPGCVRSEAVPSREETEDVRPNEVDLVSERDEHVPHEERRRRRCVSLLSMRRGKL
jgi:hypothetical protein